MVVVFGREMIVDFVTIYEDPDFGGRGIFLDVGDYRFFAVSDMNGTVSSIQVPAGLVAWAFEHADSGGGYGISADFLEDCADLTPLDLNDKISYISVFRAEQPSGLVWQRGTTVGGEYIPGHWERRRVVEPPPNTVVTVSPPFPPHMGDVTVHAEGLYAEQAQSLYTLFLRGPDDPALQHDARRFDSSLACTFSKLPVGQYWVTPDTKADVGWSVTPPRAEVVCHPFQLAQVVIRFG